MPSGSICPNDAAIGHCSQNGGTHSVNSAAAPRMLDQSPRSTHVADAVMETDGSGVRNPARRSRGRSTIGCSQMNRLLFGYCTQSHQRSAKGDIVRQAVLAQVGPFSPAELRGQLPAVSVQLVKKVLAEMKRTGEIRLTGRGRGALWERIA
jgi:hypothetical protein